MTTAATVRSFFIKRTTDNDKDRHAIGIGGLIVTRLNSK
jgi:hypothetical protein